MQVFVEGCSKVVPFYTVPIAPRFEGHTFRVEIYSTYDREMVSASRAESRFGVAFDEGL